MGCPEMKMLLVREEGLGRSYCRRRRAVMVDFPDPEAARRRKEVSGQRRVEENAGRVGSSHLLRERQPFPWES